MYCVCFCCRFYGISAHFHRLLRLLSNELSLKARDIIGHDILNDPGTACTGIRLALRVCSAFRGHYLDRKESCEEERNKCKEKQQKYQRQGLLDSENSQMWELKLFTVSVCAYTYARIMENQLGFRGYMFYYCLLVPSQYRIMEPRSLQCSTTSVS